MAAADLCVILNPASGRQRARKRFERWLRGWGSHVEVWKTQHPGHGEELARQAAGAGFGTVAAAGGDGTVHEVANGLLEAGRPEVNFGVVPLGSANDYAYSLEQRARERPDAGVRPVDVGMVRDGHGRQRYFLCCLGVGFNGAVTLESKRIRCLQGLALYGLATLRALLYRFSCPNMALTIDGQQRGLEPTLLLSVLLGRREGHFVMAPEAQLDDGFFDYVHTGAMSRWQVLRLLPRLALGKGPPAQNPQVRLGRCRQISLRSETPLLVHTDGEFFCRPEDKVRELHIQILPAALRVQLQNPEA